MSSQQFLIAPFATGLNTDKESWQLNQDSFEVADNVHIFNGYVEKRSGFRKYGHLKTYAAAVNINSITLAANGLVTTAAPHGLATDEYTYISSALGMTQVNGRVFKVTVTLPNAFLLNESTLTYGVYTGGGTSRRIIDLSERIMGIYQFITATGDKELLIFGTTRASKYNSVTKHFVPLDITPIMSGGEYDYVIAQNLQSSSLKNRLYFTNGLPYLVGLDGIRYYDGSGTGDSTISFTPSLGGGRILTGAQLLFCLHERLLAINTYELNGATTTNYPQRLRWCQAQGPSNWNDLTPGGGGYVDAPTGDQVITAKALQDQIIVFFTNSVWAAQSVSDPSLPFKWIKLNDFRACDGKMASIGFDKYVMALGTRGITATDGMDTQRIDDRIKDFISSEMNVDYLKKVYGARSFGERRTWLLFPGVEETECTKALMFDEDSQAFTTYSISMNCLGYGKFAIDYTLADFIAENDLDIVLEDCDEETLASYFWQGNDEIFLGGDINGQIYVMETETSDDGTDIVSTVTTAGWNPFITEGKQAYFPFIDIYVDTDKNATMKVEFFKDDETESYAFQDVNFLPNLDYVVSIENITNANPGIVTIPQHGLIDGQVVFFYGVLGMNEINDQPLTVTVVDVNTISIGVDTSAYGVFISNGCVYLKEFYKTKVWKRVYAGGVGYLHKLSVTSEGIDSPFRISAFKPTFKPRGTRVLN